MSAHARPAVKDLVVLVADKNMEQAVAGLLERPQSMAIRPLTYDIFVHVRRDPGCLNEAHDVLRPLAGGYDHALVLFDHQGCGREHITPEALADEVKHRLEQNGWPELAEVVVIAPELEVWVWSGSPHVVNALGWASRQPALRDWLETNGHWPTEQPKPPDPKGAMKAALRTVNKPPSSAIFHELASKVSLRGHRNSPSSVSPRPSKPGFHHDPSSAIDNYN